MSTMTDTIMQQVTEQVKKAMEASSSARPLPHFDYVPTTSCEPSHRHAPILSYLHGDKLGIPPSWSISTQTPKERSLSKDIPVVEVERHPETPIKKERKPARPEPREEECSTKTVAIAGGYIEGTTRSAWKAQLQGAQQEVNPTGMIHLPLRFGEKAKTRNLGVDFLVVDLPTAHNVILGRLTLHKVKAVIASYLLQLQFKADDGSVGKLQGDQ
ncbi:hypothetical protein Cgig2_001616 [Carnegiea gigantea]|uniref:Uncharacterized protein n=1 Tax=Carnegiea gigantea TaxID=171969 RepID=A0A9Q1GRB5_9CARY|nr:hypothetical protein Cgig2_001616 [Carnegiea gigantea]